MKALWNKGQPIIAQVLISFLGGCLAVGIFFVSLLPVFSPAASLATVDMTSLIQSFVKTESTRSGSLAEHHEQVRAFSQQLDQALQAVAQQQHVILVPKEAVIAGAVQDLTPQVRQHLTALQPYSVLPTEELEK